MQCISIRIGFLHVLKTKKKNRQYEFDQGEKFNDVIFFKEIVKHPFVISLALHIH